MSSASAAHPDPIGEDAMLRGFRATSILVGLGALLLTYAQAAADRVFTKAEAEQVAAKVVSALPPATAGWKITQTVKGAEPSSYKGRKVVVPAAARDFESVDGKKRFSMAIMYGYAAERQKTARDFEKSVGKGRGVRRIKVKGHAGYIFQGDKSIEFHLQVGAYVVFGHAFDVDANVILATLKQLNVKALKAAQ